MLSPDDVLDLLAIELIGIVPEDENVIISSNRGAPVAYDRKSCAGQAFRNIARRLQGESVPFLDLGGAVAEALLEQESLEADEIKTLLASSGARA